jgi:hypothetical protein
MAGHDLSVVIHGHFYQPPRDDPWFESVEAQPSAAPYHDWNERVTAECYDAVVAARVPGAGGRISRIVNTLEFMSFNFGPTLLAWMETEARETYEAILRADAHSRTRMNGHGNALAQAYHHTILPLASRREKTTEIRWGMADFRARFGRDPSGMWLPETAVDAETLDVLAQEGIAFTILAPHQVKNVPPLGQPGLYRTPSGRSIALFVYNGPMSHGVAFGALLNDAAQWARDMVEGEEGLVSIATDGETYGHHHRFGEMALASVLDKLDKRPGVTIENFASYLARHPATLEVALEERSSWSCSHGVERWRSDCGCKMDPSLDTQQEWRSVLRESVEWLASRFHAVFEAEGGALLNDPWAVRDIDGPWLRSDSTNPRARELLELERQALRLFTSCGWFFDDLAGLEPLQVLRYAARGLELVGPEGPEIRREFLERLEQASTNEDPPRSGKQVFLEDAEPRIPAPLRIAGGAALWASLAGVDAERDGKSGLGTSLVGEPAYKVESLGSDEYRVRHRRTLETWTVETRVRRPSQGRGVVAARAEGSDQPWVPMVFTDLPEGFRRPITSAISKRVPDPANALMTAIEDLADQVAAPDLLLERIDRVHGLADLLILLGEPIPVPAQTRFFRIFEAAGTEAAAKLTALREPLGFTPRP